MSDTFFTTSGSSPGNEETQSDFTIWVDVSIALLTPLSSSARLWIEDNISKEGFQPYWPTVVIEPRFLPPILEGITNDGLAVSR